MSPPFVSLADIQSARDRIARKVVRTPTVRSDALSERFGGDVWLKLEHRQTTGSFKLRGASNALASLAPEDKQRSVVAASTGNHGRALAYAAKLEGLRATICLSRLAPDNKLAEIRRLGAQVRIVGDSQDDAQIEVDRLVAEEGMIAVPPFDHAAIVAGQGTVGAEIAEDVPDVDLVVTPVSGGGLVAGVAAAIRALRPRARVVGVSVRRGAAMKASLDAGRPVLCDELPTLADSLGGGIGLDNQLTFRMCRDLLDDLILLSEPEIAAGIEHAYRVEREIVEGAGAVAIGALLAGKLPQAKTPVLLLSGRNIDMDLHRRIVSGERNLFGKDAS
jgi:threonine dehydratase